MDGVGSDTVFVHMSLDRLRQKSKFSLEPAQRRLSEAADRVDQRHAALAKRFMELDKARESKKQRLIEARRPENVAAKVLPPDVLRTIFLKYETIFHRPNDQLRVQSFYFRVGRPATYDVTFRVHTRGLNEREFAIGAECDGTRRRIARLAPGQMVTFDDLTRLTNGVVGTPAEHRSAHFRMVLVAVSQGRVQGDYEYTRPIKRLEPMKAPWVYVLRVLWRWLELSGVPVEKSVRQVIAALCRTNSMLESHLPRKHSFSI